MYRWIPCKIKTTKAQWRNRYPPEKQATGPDDFSGKFYQTLTGEILSILHYLFQKIEEKETVSNSFYLAITITLIPNSDKGIRGKNT